MAYIYALIDPRTGLTRYIGKTDNPSKRRYGHREYAKKYPNTPKGCWVSELSAEGLTYIFQILEKSDDWETDERKWILFAKAAGLDLVNQTEGGNGPSDNDRELFRKLSTGRPGPNKGRKFSDETRAKMSKARIGKLNPMYGVPSPNTGKKFTEEHKRKISESRKKHFKKDS